MFGRLSGVISIFLRYPTMCGQIIGWYSQAWGNLSTFETGGPVFKSRLFYFVRTVSESTKFYKMFEKLSRIIYIFLKVSNYVWTEYKCSHVTPKMFSKQSIMIVYDFFLNAQLQLLLRMQWPTI